MEEKVEKTYDSSAIQVLEGLEAINPFTGKRFSERDYQTTVYFDEVKVNTEDTNPEFMEVIANVYGKDSDVYDAYKKASFTDGQGYRTLKSYRAVMGMAGAIRYNVKKYLK